MEELLKQLSKRDDLAFFIDMGYELHIYKKNSDPFEDVYSGDIHSFAEDLLNHFNVENDG